MSKRSNSPGRVVLDYLASLEDAWMMVRVPSVLMPFAVFTAIQCVVLVALGLLPVPPVTRLVAPLIEALGGEAALHYPMHFILLPTMYHTIYLVLFIVPGFLLFYSGVSAMAEHIGSRDKVKLPARPGFLATTPMVIVLGAIYVLCAAGIPAVFATVAEGIRNPRAAQAVGLVGIVLSVGAQTLLVYSLLAVRAFTLNPFLALRRSAALGWSHFPVTALLIVTVVVAHAPIDYLIAHADGLAIKFRPEFVLYVLLLGTLIELVTTVFLFAATTAVALSRREVGFR